MLEVIAGFLLLLGGLKLAQEGLVRLAGNRATALLGTLLAGPWCSFLAGLAAAALTQSSTAVSVLTVGLVHSRFLPLPEAIGVILGANVGTTLTVQLMALKPGAMAYCLGALGILLLLKRPPWRHAGMGFLGLGMIFAGIAWFESGCKGLGQHPWLLAPLNAAEESHFLAFLLSTLVTALVHSSSLTTGLAMTLYAQGVITRETALVFVLGNNLGTCFTALLVSLVSSNAGRRVALAHFLVNLGGALLFFPLLHPWGMLARWLSSGPAHEIANAHTLYNLVTSLILLPFCRPLARLLEKLLPDH
ncbi:Na+/Picotransporter [Ammonifex degensii KC4]|uniref:Na+/Picotransporter n=1 Tax=Ammonifex degensii (strain DSM 10501 / KC4) TaxID=429009 RepID=C9RAU4_AMMDK|nr:Na/Pi symporter [Ammonifex degensii]ACX51371.1 Na+/Picotransporter [Ammonifex degensii KC4]